jgi:hypothetical protein
VISAPLGAVGDHFSTCAANLYSHLIIVACDFSNNLPVALTPIPSVLALIDIDTIIAGVLILPSALLYAR